MSNYHGDIRLGDTIDIKFVTTAASTGAPTQLAGSPVISAYPGNSTTQLTAGITLTVDFDTVTGLNNCRVVATSGNGYATATNYELVITTGTVGGTSAVGYTIGSFSIENRSALMPTTAARTLDVSAGGEAGVDWANVGSPTTTLNLSGTSTKALEPTTAGRTLDVATTGEAGVDFSNILMPSSGAISGFAIVDSGTAQAATSTTIQLRSAAAFADSELVGATVVIRSATAGAGQSRVITAYTGSTDTATVDAWTTTPTGTIVYDIIATPPASATSIPAVNVTQFGGNAGTFSGGRPEVNTTHIAGSAVSTSSAQIGVNVVNAGGTAWGSGAITAASIATDAITAAKIADGAIDAATFAAGAINAAAIAADAIGASELAADAVTEIVTGVLTTAMTEAYATDGSTMTVAQALYLIAQSIGEFSVSGTTLTVKKLDGTTTAATYTLDSATAPTSRTRAT